MTNQPTDYYVYTLLDPRDAERVIYVGMGRGVRRYMRTRRAKRLAAFIAEHGSPPSRVIASGLTKEAAFILEVELIARYGRECDGGQLLNVSCGGPGAPGRIIDAESREKMAAAHRGQRLSEATIAKILAAKKGKQKRGWKCSPETIEGMRARQIAFWAACSPTKRAKMTAKAHEASRGRRPPVEEREKMRIAAKARWARKRLERLALALGAEPAAPE
jgi:hypothetical protein